MATLVDTPTILRALPRVQGRLQSLGAEGAVTTYCYRESGGTRGTATSLDAIPAGAEIERTVRS
jgi:hypothetical protein